jgi:RNA polymerase sigma-70 factor (ECF subfamily)
MRRSEAGAAMSSRSPTLRVISDVDTESDVDLLERIAAGDEHAAAVLVRRYQADVVRFLSRMLGAGDPAVDDVTQLTFVAALDAARSYRGSAKARTWLLGIAHNKAKMHIRSRMRRRKVVDLFRTFTRTQPDAAPPDSDAREIGRRIADALQELDADRRGVFVLVEIEGLTCRDAAATLGAPEGTVRRWRVEARKALQPLLADLRGAP